MAVAIALLVNEKSTHDFVDRAILHETSVRLVVIDSIERSLNADLLKTRRICMLACVGYIIPEYFRWPGYLSPEKAVFFVELDCLFLCFCLGFMGLVRAPGAVVCRICFESGKAGV